jgi:hypothetical protein
MPEPRMKARAEAEPQFLAGRLASVFSSLGAIGPLLGVEASDRLGRARD